MKSNMLNQEQSIEIQKKFLKTFHKKKPDSFNEFVNKLKHCIAKKMNSESLYSELKGSPNKTS